MAESGGQVLIVDDEPAYIEMLAEALEADGHECLFATSGEEALALARTQGPDLVLLDVLMPGMDGYDVCRALKADGTTAGVPVIFVTALEETKDEALGLEIGAIDFITKPLSEPIVRVRVRNHLELKRARDALAELAVTDWLTGLANRRRFDEALAEEMRRVARAGGPLSLILLDVDHFKRFNDTYGHAAGDRCLQKVAGALQGRVRRPADLVARYGGEEFGCVLPETDHAGALEVAHGIHDAIADLARECLAEEWEPVTVSQGVATLADCRDWSPHDLVCLADEELYRAKALGRNRTCGRHG